jgi:polyhydroxyalkanoate synthesis regulator phasin
MAGFENIVKKAFYLGVGFASYATEKASATLSELRVQAQKLADEMVERGELSTEEARKFVDDIVRQAQQENVPPPKETNTKDREPRRIEILSEDEESGQKKPDNVDSLRQQVESLQEELRRLKRE